MLPLLVFQDPEDVTEAFEERRDAAGWCYASASQYWSAMLKARETLQLTIPHLFRAQQRMYMLMKNEEEATRETLALPREVMLTVFGNLLNKNQVASAHLLRLAFELGQRIGDTSKVMRKNVYRMTDPATKLKLIAVHFRAGKVTKRKNPFTLHLADTECEWFHTFANLPPDETARQKQCVIPMFGEQALLAVKKEMQLTCPTYNLLSVRKGGLQDLARQGMSKSCLLHHSRHATVDMLDRYLGWGSWNLEAARERFLWRESLYLPGRVEEQRPP
jgi:hypothetical protein